MANKTFYINCENFGEHEVEATFSITIENDGIGWYEYWGAKCYDAGTDYPVLDEIEDVYLVRCGQVKDKEDIPKCTGITYSPIKDKETKEIIGYHWEHRRAINANDEIEEAISNYLDEADPDDYMDYPEPDYDDYDDYDDRW